MKWNLTPEDMSSQFQDLDKHVIEYYRGNKYLGSTTHDGQVPQSQVGYNGRRNMTSGQVVFKRIHRATEEDPLTIIYYNLQGRINNAATKWHDQ